MPRPCSICTNVEREAINSELVERKPFRRVAQRYGVSETALHRHKKNCIPADLAKAAEVVKLTQAGTLLEQVCELGHTAREILEQARRAGDLRTALAGIGQAKGCLELQAKLAGELDESPKIAFMVTPEFTRFRDVLFAALEPYPDARYAAAQALMEAGRVP
jgi:hypothetical protein